MRIYVASSWKNAQQPTVCEALRSAGHEVYDFRHPKDGENGFHWSEIDGGWRLWGVTQYLRALDAPVAEYGFNCDMDALLWCDACVLVLPCGRSSHLEAGWAIGAGKRMVIYLPEFDTPELMYKMADGVVATLPEVIALLERP